MSSVEPAELFRRFVTSRGLKSTRQRDAIAEVFLAHDGHLSVEELISLARRRDPRVSAATVYRTVKLLTEAGLARASDFGEGQVRYEATAGKRHHDHLVCTACGAIAEFEDERIEHLQTLVARRHRFEVTSHKLELYGRCERCRRAGGPSAP